MRGSRGSRGRLGGVIRLGGRLMPGIWPPPPAWWRAALGGCPMPFIQGKDVRLYYERTGQGPKLLFVNGSGVTMDDSRLLLSLFASHFDFVAYDYRGLGESSEPPGPYGMAECAGDALSVLDAVGWEAACVLGISFGGMVAQELAVTAPGRVRRLALLCTSPGGKGGSSYPLDELESLPRGERVGVLRQLVDIRFDDQWLASHPQDHRLVELLAGRDAAPDPGQQRGRARQLAARRSHDVWDRLPSITCPAFIGCGRFDGIAPPRLSAAIVSRIPGAQLHTYEGGHLFIAQDPRCMTDVVSFLSGDGAP
jgi:3-oxoadipate enol-lactonase